MPRVKRGVAAKKRKKPHPRRGEGHTTARAASCSRRAREAVERGWKYAYRDRKQRKRDFRALWIARINAAAREHGISYSRLVHGTRAGGRRGRSQDPRGARAGRSEGASAQLAELAKSQGRLAGAAAVPAPTARPRGAARARRARRSPRRRSAQALQEVRARFLGPQGLGRRELLRGIGALSPPERAARRRGRQPRQARDRGLVVAARRDGARARRHARSALGRAPARHQPARRRAAAGPPAPDHARACATWCGFFSSLGFSIEEGPEVETD